MTNQDYFWIGWTVMGLVAIGIALHFRRVVHKYGKHSAYFEILRGRDKKWYWHLKAANHGILAQSQGYQTKDNALRGIEAVIRGLGYGRN